MHLPSFFFQMPARTLKKKSTTTISCYFFYCIRFGAERYEQRDMQIRVRRRFEQLQAQDEADSVNGTPWYVIDAAQSVDKVHLDLQQVVQTTMTKVNNGAPLRKLWSSLDKN